jgi:hypothetical protein
MVGAGVEVVLHPGHDRPHVPPGHDGVGQPVAAAVGHVLLGEAQAEQVVAIVGQGQVHLGVVPGDGPGGVGVGLEDHRLLDAEQGVGAEGLAGNGGVLGGHEVGVGPFGPLG